MKEFEMGQNLETGLDVMKLPEIEIKSEKGVILLSALLKGYDLSWGGHGHELVNEVEKYFKQNPLSQKSITFLSGIMALEDDGVSEEVLYEIALTLNDTERIPAVIDFISKYKYKITNFQELREGFVSVLRELDLSLPEDLKKQMEIATFDDIKKRNENIKETAQKIQKLIDFFKPNAETTKIKKIEILPTDFLYDEQSGTAFEFGDTTILHSHIDNPGNLEHEFLHSVINPIIEKLEQQLSQQQKQKISEMSSYRLRVEEGYGDQWLILLFEEFIRTYNDVVQKGERPLSYDDFTARINEISDEQFQEAMQNDKKLKNRCDQLEIASIEELKQKSIEYYARFGDGALRDVVYNFYVKYIKEKGTNTNFESFVLSEFKNMI